MRCELCGGERLVPAEYIVGEVRAPARACATCNAFIFDEALARSEDERRVIRQAIAIRRVSFSMPSGTMPSGDAATEPKLPAAHPDSGTFKTGGKTGPPMQDETGIRKQPRRR